MEPMLIEQCARAARNGAPPPERPARKPSPRPRAGRWRPMLPRLALAVVLLAAASALAGRVVQAAARPLVAIHRTGSDIQALEDRRDQLELRHRRLLALKAYLQTPTGIEEEARRQGWVRRGETAIQIVRPEGASPNLLDDAPLVQTRRARPGGFRGILETYLVVLRGGSR